MLAQCSATTIQMGGEDVKVSKTLIGVIVVFFDLIITFIFWCSLLGLKKLQEAQEKEMNGEAVSVSDFSVMVAQEPYTETLDDLTAVYYAWAENICSREALNLVDPTTGEADDNQNQVWNVQLGLTNLGYLAFMRRMSALLVQKKKLEALKRKLESEGKADSKPYEKAVKKLEDI